jgi:hypothetical protein
MTLSYVDVEALNLRSRPVADPGTRVAILHLGQQVERIEDVERMEDVDQAGWVRIGTTVDGAPTEGFVKAEFLRQPVPDPREALIEQAVKEWLRFEKGLGKEDVDPFYRYVGEMWQAIGLDLDGKDRDVPWSAAAISFMVRHAGKKAKLYKKFRFAPAHARYIHDSIKKRLDGDTATPFWGFRLHENRPQLGDLVCRWRETPRTFDDAVTQDSFKSHCDIIVRITANDVLAIGGNVNQSVSITTYKLTESGFLADRDEVFAHLVNRA